MLAASYEWCISMLKWHVTGAVDATKTQLQKTAEITYLEGKKKQTR